MSGDIVKVNKVGLNNGNSDVSAMVGGALMLLSIEMHVCL